MPNPGPLLPMDPIPPRAMAALLAVVFGNRRPWVRLPLGPGLIANRRGRWARPKP